MVMVTGDTFLTSFRNPKSPTPFTIAGLASRINAIIRGSLFWITCIPSLLGPSSSVGGKVGTLETYGVVAVGGGVAVGGVGNGVRVGIGKGMVGVAEASGFLRSAAAW